jgi:hypothetical protein
VLRCRGGQPLGVERRWDQGHPFAGDAVSLTSCVRPVRGLCSSSGPSQPAALNDGPGAASSHRLGFEIAAWSVDRLGRSLQDLVGFRSETRAAREPLYRQQQAVDTDTSGSVRSTTQCPSTSRPSLWGRRRHIAADDPTPLGLAPGMTWFASRPAASGVDKSVRQRRLEVSRWSGWGRLPCRHLSRARSASAVDLAARQIAVCQAHVRSRQPARGSIDCALVMLRVVECV